MAGEVSGNLDGWSVFRNNQGKTNSETIVKETKSDNNFFQTNAMESVFRNLNNTFQNVKADNLKVNAEKRIEQKNIKASIINELKSVQNIKTTEKPIKAEETKEKPKGLFEAIGEFFSNLFKGIGEFFKNVFGGLVNLVKQILPILSIVSLLIPGLQIVGLIAKGIELFDSLISGDLLGVVKGIAGFLTGGIANIINKGIDYLQKGLNLVKSFTDFLKGEKNLLDFLQDGLGFIGDFAKGAFAKTLDTAKYWLNKARGFIKGFGELLRGNILGFFQSGLDFFDGITEGGFGKFIKDAKDFLGGGWKNFVSDLLGNKLGLSRFFQKLFGADFSFPNFLKALFNSL